MTGLTENQPPPPKLIVAPAAFEQLMEHLGLSWRMVEGLSYDRDRAVLTVKRIRLNEAGFPQRDRFGQHVTESFEVVVGS